MQGGLVAPWEDTEGSCMSMVLNHTIVRARDKQRSARWFADLFGLQVGGTIGPFAPVRINPDLTFDFDDRWDFAAGHYAFLVDDTTFDSVLKRIVSSANEYGSGPRTLDRQINRLNGGRGVYVNDADGNSYEMFTTVPSI
jgi:catechol 2,3-dioxygenase-like lactoylglutathione lyase family enzyme